MQQQQQYNSCTLFYVLLYRCCTILLCVHFDARAHPDAFARASTRPSPRGGRAPVSPCLYPCPRTHGEAPHGGAPASPTLITSDKKSTYNNGDNNIDTQQVSILYMQIDKGPVKPMHLIASTKCYWLMWDNDWLGA